jgi:hypothetical protein
MKQEVGHLGLLNSLGPYPAQIVEQPALRCLEHRPTKSLTLPPNLVERVHNHSIHGHATVLPGLALPHRHRARIEIHVLPFEARKFALSHPGVKDHDDPTASGS